MNNRDDFDKRFSRIMKLGVRGVIAVVILSLLASGAVIGAVLWLVFTLIEYLRTH